MRKSISAAFAISLLSALLFGGVAKAQTPPNWTYGYVPSQAEWNTVFAGKQDYLGSPSLLTGGGTMTGPLITAAPTSVLAGFNLPPGVAPASPNNGDVWTTLAGMFVRINGVTIGPLAAGTGGSFTATSPIAVSFPGGGVVNYAFDFSIANTFLARQTDQGATTTAPGWYAQITADTSPRARFGVSSTDVPGVALGPGNAALDTFLERAATATFRLGAPDAAAPVAQTVGTQNVVAGTSNTAGAQLTINGSRSTGTGAGGAIVLQTAPAGSTGSAQNALVTAVKVFPDGAVNVGAPTGGDKGTFSINSAGLIYVNNSAVAVAATTPIVLNATTGTLTCPTCLTGTGGALTAAVTTTSGFSAGQILRSDGSLLQAYSISGTGNVAMTNSPTLVTPTIGAALATTINGVTISTGTGTLSLGSFTQTLGGNMTTAGAVTFSGAFGFTGTLTGTTALTFPTSGTVTALGNTVTGSGSIVLATSPTLVTATLTNPTMTTPVLGVATGTSLALGGATLGGNALAVTGTMGISGQIASTLATGTAPFAVASTTNVANLNASSLNGATFAAPGAIGSGTPGTGAFTTLSATSTISGAGFTAWLASPPAIGGTAPNTGAFTTLASGAHTVTSAGAAALAVGLNGATNPALTVDASTALSATGVSIKSAAAAGGVALAATSSGTNENLTVNAKGSGTITLGSVSTGAVTITPGTVFGAGITAAALPAPSGNIAGSICATSGGAFLYSVSSNCFAAGAASAIAPLTTQITGGTNGDILAVTTSGCSSGSPCLAQLATVPVSAGGTGDSGTAWTSYTVNPLCGGGAGTWTGTTGSYKTIGKTVFVSIRIVLSNVGSCAGNVFSFALPLQAQSPGTMMVRENNAGAGYTGFFDNTATTVSVFSISNTTPSFATGNVFLASFVYQSN